MIDVDDPQYLDWTMLVIMVLIAIIFYLWDQLKAERNMNSRIQHVTKKEIDRD